MNGQHAIGHTADRGFTPRSAQRRLLPDADLARLLLLVQTVVPSLRCEQSDQPLRESGWQHASMIAVTLSSHWRSAYLEAGPHYAALRCWGLAIWQPIYLSVVAAHLDTYVPYLTGLTQSVVDGFPQKIRLPIHAPVTGTLSLRVKHAATELDAFCRTMRAALMPMVGLHACAADRLQAECVLGALLQVQRHDPTMSNAETILMGDEWLSLLHITGGCSFFTYRARDGTSQLALDRQVCCHHFRRHDGDKCSTCPKLSLDTRIARLTADQS